MPIHWRSMSVTARDGRWHPLPRQKFLVLRALHEAQGGIRSNRELIDELFADDPDGGPLNAGIQLRSVLYNASRRLAGSEHYIDTAYGRGWRLLTQELQDAIARRELGAAR